jgi:hypothetical protein
MSSDRLIAALILMISFDSAGLIKNNKFENLIEAIASLRRRQGGS